MKLPSNLSVFYCSQFALYLKDPIRFPKPSGTAFTCGSGRDPPVKQSPSSAIQRRWRQGKNKENTRLKTDQGKGNRRAPRELVKNSDTFSQFSVHQDKISDFTVLDLHTDNQAPGVEDVTNQLEEKCDPFLELPSSSTSSSSSETPRGRKCEDITSENVMAVVNKLEKLLQQEKYLSKRTDIFHCLGSLKKLVTNDAGKVNNRRDRDLLVDLQLFSR